MSGRKGFIRSGFEDLIEIRDMYTKIDYYSIVEYYEILKKGNSSQTLPGLLEDSGKVTEEVADCLEDIINSVLTQIVKVNRPFTEFKEFFGAKAFDFIMHDPSLKQAVGNVTMHVFMREKKINHEIAKQKAQKVLANVRDNFLDFLLELMDITLPQIDKIMKIHSIDEKELLRMGGPIIETIYIEENKSIIKLGFKSYDPDKRSPADKMFE